MLSIKEKLKKVVADYTNQVVILDAQILNAWKSYRMNKDDLDYLIDLKQLQAQRESKHQALMDIRSLEDYL